MSNPNPTPDPMFFKKSKKRTDANPRNEAPPSGLDIPMPETSPTADSLTVSGNARHCARCKGDHMALEFKRLEFPVDGEGVSMTHWCTCPTNGEPILMAILENLPKQAEPQEAEQANQGQPEAPAATVIELSLPPEVLDRVNELCAHSEKILPVVKECATRIEAVEGKLEEDKARILERDSGYWQRVKVHLDGQSAHVERLSSQATELLSRVGEQAAMIEELDQTLLGLVDAGQATLSRSATVELSGNPGELLYAERLERMVCAVMHYPECDGSVEGFVKLAELQLRAIDAHLSKQGEAASDE